MDPAEWLIHIPVFAGLSSADRGSLAARLRRVSFSAFQPIFDEHDLGDAMYVVESGTVEIFLAQTGKPHRVLLRELSTGSYFGELSLFDDKPRSASARAKTGAVVLRLSREDFLEHLVGSRGMTLAVLSELANRLRDTNALLSERASRDVDRELEDKITWGQKLADKVAALNGSWAFIGVIVALTAAWALLNRFAEEAFDPYPYQFYNLFLAMLVALQGPLIVMSQNRQAIKERARAETDFRVNLKNEVGIERLLGELAAFRNEVLGAKKSPSNRDSVAGPPS